MLNLKTFVEQNNNKKVEVIGPESPNQCFDLVVKWCDNLGIPRQPNGRSVFPFQYAYQIYTNFGELQAKYFTKIFNDPNAVPKEGDILVWSYYYNYSAGHTAIYHSGDVLRVKAFSQNDPVGKPCILRDYSYSNILGWLRPKMYNPNQPLTDSQKIAKLKETLLKSGTTDTQKVLDSKTILGI